MTPLTLSPEEIEQAKTGKVTLVRPVEPQPPEDAINYPSGISNNDDFWLGCEKYPFGKVGDEFWVRGDLARGMTSDGKITRLILTHKGTTVERVRDVTKKEIMLTGIKPPDSLEKGVTFRGCYGEFYDTWQSKYGDKFPWSTNPWVFISDMEVKK